MPRASAALPFVRAFYGRPSQAIWSDDAGNVHDIHQSEGGEQGDPWMPSLYALGQHPALAAVSVSLEQAEKIFAFLDDIYLICQPERVSILYDLLQASLWTHARIRIHLGKTKIWNSAGVRPANCERMVNSEGVPSWRGDHNMSTRMQGLKILGIPIGHTDFIEAEMSSISQEHS